MTLHQSSAAKAGRAANNPLSDGFDLFRLDCAVDALRDVQINPDDRAELARIYQNLTDLMETQNGHAH